MILMTIPVLVHRAPPDKARQDVLRSSTVSYRPTNPDFVADLSEFFLSADKILASVRRPLTQRQSVWEESY